MIISQTNPVLCSRSHKNAPHEHVKIWLHSHKIVWLSTATRLCLSPSLHDWRLGKQLDKARVHLFRCLSIYVCTSSFDLLLQQNGLPHLLGVEQSCLTFFRVACLRAATSLAALFRRVLG